MNEVKIVRLIDEDEFSARMSLLHSHGWLLQNSGYDNGVWWAIFTSWWMD